MTATPASLDVFGERLDQLGWVHALLVAGSLATSDYVPGVSDLDLVAVVDGPVDDARVAELAALHRQLDGCQQHGACSSDACTSVLSSCWT